MWIIVLFKVSMLTIIRYFVTDQLLCCSRSAHIASQWGGPVSSLSRFSQWNGPVSQWYWSPAIFYACVIIIVHLTRTCAHLSEAASLMMKHSSRPYNCHTQSSWFADWLIWGLQGAWNHRTLPKHEMFSAINLRGWIINMSTMYVVNFNRLIDTDFFSPTLFYISEFFQY